MGPGLEETVARQTAQAKLKARRGNGTGGVKATPIRNDVEYVSPIKIGGQTVTVDFDTGLLTSGFDISYGDGSGAAGNVGTDVVDIGGATVTRQAIEMATALSASFVEDTANNGLMGLAFSKLNTVKPQKQKTFFDNVMPSLAEPVFTADLKKAAVGAYEFGRVDPAKFVGQMTYVPVNTSNGFWQFPSESFSVDGGAPQPGQAGGQAIADTGTTIILANPVTVEGYYAAVPGAVNDQQQGGFTGATSTSPKSATRATTSDVQIYGDVMFKTQFVAFNGGNNSLGFAEHADGQGRPTQLGKQQQQKQGTGETQPLRGVVNESSAGPARAASLILVGAVPALTVILGWYI
ncbi:putative aspergillopepsin A-like aspartic endopeptidase [Verticillium longisporum]|uniref:Putative aspergillopepsin A-like aspartic endopeptidase n=1 Tax=Verticillium longisporum TaxID=100787 RepID=A0A8I3ATE6_VERLO|nr:putative aspergillopepsin A-like aspartic endopeptidase [Verticillium longisporum]